MDHYFQAELSVSTVKHYWFFTGFKASMWLHNHWSFISRESFDARIKKQQHWLVIANAAFSASQLRSEDVPAWHHTAETYEQ